MYLLNISNDKALPFLRKTDCVHLATLCILNHNLNSRLPQQVSTPLVKCPYPIEIARTSIAQGQEGSVILVETY